MEFQSKISEIKNLNLTFLIDPIIAQFGCSRREAVLAVKQYKNFLILILKYSDSEKLYPTDEIDEVWHLHILHTKHYQNYCERIFGKFIHHHPTHSDDCQDQDESFCNTLDLYLCEFNKPLRSVVAKGFLSKLINKICYLFIRYSTGNLSKRKKLLRYLIQ